MPQRKLPAIGEDATAFINGTDEEEKKTTAPAPSSSLADVLPTVGGVIGGFAARHLGPVPGALAAAAGGAAGEGYRQIAKHAGEIPGAIKDVARNIVEHPRETWRGAVEGATEGRTNAAKAAVTQGALELGGRGISRGLTGASQGLKVINASPIARQYGATWKNLATGLGALGAKASGNSPAMGAILGRLLANPASFRLLTEGMEQGARLPYAQIGRGVDAYRQLPEEEPEP